MDKNTVKKTDEGWLQPQIDIFLKQYVDGHSCEVSVKSEINLP